jgi:hypothetical protein
VPTIQKASLSGAFEQFDELWSPRSEPRDTRSTGNLALHEVTADPHLRLDVAGCPRSQSRSRRGSRRQRMRHCSAEKARRRIGIAKIRRGRGSVQRFFRPVPVTGCAHSDLLQPPVAAAPRSSQEVDGQLRPESWSESTSCGIDNRRKEPLHSGQRSGGAVAACFKPYLGARRDNFRDNLGDSGFPVTQSLSYT